MRRRFLAIAALALLSVASAGPFVPAHADEGTRTDETDGAAWPTSFSLPDGFQPEGIATGPGAKAYFGSRVNGAIYRVDLRTGQGAVFSAGPGTPSLGLKVDDRNRLFVAGGAGGNARVVDTYTGEVLASYTFATGDTFVNDVVLTRDAAWFTDSRVPVLYKLPLSGWRRTLPDPSEVVRVPLTGDIVYGTGINANGIVTSPDQRSLVLVQSNTGKLFQVDPDTGATKLVDLGEESLPNGDGLLRQGRNLYVVQNRLNQVAKVRLDFAGSSGKVLTRVTDPAFDVPATVAAFGHRLYLPNARFTTPPTPTTPYSAVAIDTP
ncbi:SMP-30/gluconolactonase/LRE family protein [Pendulispora rubella]|uniref:SMP-30/gluconolactonase/LRE family protein n=1 Tax=Pendulispora rubella TaxID=2741070 RepID=A0ABZ2KVH5_9BACT